MVGVVVVGVFSKSLLGAEVPATDVAGDRHPARRL